MQLRLPYCSGGLLAVLSASGLVFSTFKVQKITPQSSEVLEIGTCLGFKRVGVNEEGQRLLPLSDLAAHN
jgi:hypothetical protein